MLVNVRKWVFRGGLGLGGLFLVMGLASGHLPSLLIAAGLVGAGVLSRRSGAKPVLGAIGLIAISLAILANAQPPRSDLPASSTEPTRESPRRGVEIIIDATPEATLTVAPQPVPTNTTVPLPTDTVTIESKATSTQPAATTPTKQATPRPKNTGMPVPAVMQPTQPPVVVVLPTFTPVPVVVAPTDSPVPVTGGYVCGDGTACIKGNINSDGERIYHFPGCASYNRTQIDPGRGERWFTTSAEAEAAGWRRAQNCPK